MYLLVHFEAKSEMTQKVPERDGNNVFLLLTVSSARALQFSNSYGIDCADILEWRMWTPGGEYTLSLNMKKNMKKKTKRLLRLSLNQ